MKLINCKKLRLEPHIFYNMLLAEAVDLYNYTDKDNQMQATFFYDWVVKQESYLLELATVTVSSMEDDALYDSNFDYLVKLIYYAYKADAYRSLFGIFAPS